MSPSLLLIAISAAVGALAGWVISRVAVHLPEILLERQAREWATAMGSPTQISHRRLRSAFAPAAKGLPYEGLFVLATACGAAVLAASQHSFSAYSVLAAGYYLTALLLMGIIDQRTMLLPDSLTGPFLWAGLLAAALQYGRSPNAIDSIVGAAAGYLVLAVLAFAAKQCTNRDIMGRGDPRLLAGIGAWCGVTALHDVLTITLLICPVFLLLARRPGLGWKSLAGTHLAFGPPLAIGGAIAYFIR